MFRKSPRSWPDISENNTWNKPKTICRLRGREERNKYYLAEFDHQHMFNDGSNPKRTMPVCLSPEQLKLLTEYAKKKGMTNYNQAIEYLATEINSQ